MAEGVLITGVYGSGKSSVAAEIAYLLEQRRQPYALLDLDFLGWGGGQLRRARARGPADAPQPGRGGVELPRRRISVFVLAWFVRDRGALRNVREAVGIPLRVVRLSVPLPDIERRLAVDVTTERQEELRQAAASIAAAEGVGVEDAVVDNDRPVPVVAREVLTWLGWR